jgi:predicted dehydrogenase
VYGERGSVELGEATVEFAQPEAPLQLVRRAGRGPAPDTGRATHRLQYVDFIAAVREQRPPAVTTRDGRVALATITAMYASARSGRAVEVDRNPSSVH